MIFPPPVQGQHQEELCLKSLWLNSHTVPPYIIPSTTTFWTCQPESLSLHVFQYWPFHSTLCCISFIYVVCFVAMNNSGTLRESFIWGKKVLFPQFMFKLFHSAGCYFFINRDKVKDRCASHTRALMHSTLGQVSYKIAASFHQGKILY